MQVVPAAKEMTHLPIIVDPSHATLETMGKTMALSAIAAGADGIMIEVHPNPKKALVDPLQPIDFKELKNLMPLMNKVAKTTWNKKLY